MFSGGFLCRRRPATSGVVSCAGPPPPAAIGVSTGEGAGPTHEGRHMPVGDACDGGADEDSMRENARCAGGSGAAFAGEVSLTRCRAWYMIGCRTRAMPGPCRPPQRASRQPHAGGVRCREEPCGQGCFVPRGRGSPGMEGFASAPCSSGLRKGNDAPRIADT